jgi:thiamine biosynthesis lipoprotein
MNQKSEINRIFFCFLLPVFCILLTFSVSCTSKKERIFKKSSILMDTIVTITVVSTSEEIVESAMDAAFAEIEKIEKLSNFFSQESDVSRINQNAGVSAVKVSPDILSIIDKAIYVSEITDGSFDITIGPVISLYDFHRKIKPDNHEIQKKLLLVNYRDIVIDKNRSTVFLRKKGMRIDLGGITKGYAADKAADTLKNQGIYAAIVAIAGDIRVSGLKPDGKAWKIGIKKPRIFLPAAKVDADGLPDDVMAILEMTDMSISTSGDYERFFMVNGRRYHHILSPKTGFPAEGCQSVSITGKESALTDAIATGVFILGPEKGMQFLKEIGLEGIIIDGEGKILATPNFREKLEFTKNP